MNSQIKTPWKKVVAVHPLSNFTLKLEWEDGRQDLIDLAPLIREREMLWRLRTYRYFKQVSIDPLGGIFWPQGEDIAPGFLLDQVKE